MLIFLLWKAALPAALFGFAGETPAATTDYE
jgi:hypothetical protein